MALTTISNTLFSIQYTLSLILFLFSISKCFLSLNFHSLFLIPYSHNPLSCYRYPHRRRHHRRQNSHDDTLCHHPGTTTLCPSWAPIPPKPRHNLPHLLLLLLLLTLIEIRFEFCYYILVFVWISIYEVFLYLIFYV